MKKIKVLVLGLGNFGHSWADHIVPGCEDAELVGVVDKNIDTWTGIPADVPCFDSIEFALGIAEPDLVINVTPPKNHLALNEYLLKNKVAVLCEKPIADTLENALAIEKTLEETKGFLMYGENYRYHAAFRKVRELLNQNIIGSVHNLTCNFRHYHPDYSKFYHGGLTHPLIMDVSIHHLDLARFISGKEPLSTKCIEYSAPYSWYGDRPATAVIETKMTDNVMFHYYGTLAAASSTTDWNADWEIEGDKGVLKISQSRIYLYQNETCEEIIYENNYDDSRIAMLKEACAAINEGRKGKTDYYDNIKTYKWMQDAIADAEKRN